jgi:hypothetical protein
MKARHFRKSSGLNHDLKRLRELAYHRFESSQDLVLSFDRFRRVDHPDFDLLQKLYDWLFVPITLWPFNIEGLFRTALDHASRGKRLDKTMVFVIDLLPPVPIERTRCAISEHEHAVQHGNYESLIRAHYKYDQVEHELARDEKFQSDWSAIKAQFDVTNFADRKGIIRRPLVAERSMREDWAFCWRRIDDRFHVVFAAFCQRWNLYGMQRDRPLLLKLTANLTPFGTMIFIPAYWSFDPKRDLNWRAITALHKARGMQKQGIKLKSNQKARHDNALLAAQLSKQAAALKLKGRARQSLIMTGLRLDLRTDERQLRRILAKSRDGT